MVGTDLDDLRAWWAVRSGDVPERVRGLWFGIVDLVVNGRPVRHLYVAGCPTFDAGEDGDWASDYCWWPDHRYVRLRGLASMPAEPYQEVLGAAAALVRALAPAEGLGYVEGVGVGFDDGDFEVVWTKEPE